MRQGFTLTEMLYGIAIFGILLFLGYSIYLTGIMPVLVEITWLATIFYWCRFLAALHADEITNGDMLLPAILTVLLLLHYNLI